MPNPNLYQNVDLEKLKQLQQSNAMFAPSGPAAQAQMPPSPELQATQQEPGEQYDPVALQAKLLKQMAEQKLQAPEQNENAGDTYPAIEPKRFTGFKNKVGF